MKCLRCCFFFFFFDYFYFCWGGWWHWGEVFRNGSGRDLRPRNAGEHRSCVHGTRRRCRGGEGASGLKEARLHSHSLQSQPTPPDPAVVARVGGALGKGRDRDRVPRPSSAHSASGQRAPPRPGGPQAAPSPGLPNPLSSRSCSLAVSCCPPPNSAPSPGPRLYFLCLRPRDWPAGSASLSAPSSAGRSGNFLRFLRT